MIHFLAAGLFWRHVGHRAEGLSSLGQPHLPRQLRQPEVHDLHGAPLGSITLAGLMSRCTIPAV